jgi:hypothetical protein
VATLLEIMLAPMILAPMISPVDVLTHSLDLSEE